MMLHDIHPERTNDDIGRLIGMMPYQQPDPGLPDRIMAQLRPARPGVLKRIYRWSRTPMTFSVSPAFGMLALCLLVLPAGLVFLNSYHAQAPELLSRQGDGQTPVFFQFKDSAAQSVSVIGTFNNWDPKGYEMSRNPVTGDWVFKTKLAPGKHDYVFLVDGEKVYTDPNADLHQKDEYGNSNSVLFVKGNNGQKI